MDKAIEAKRELLQIIIDFDSNGYNILAKLQVKKNDINMLMKDFLIIKIAPNR